MCDKSFQILNFVKTVNIFLVSHFRQSLLPPPATCISLDHSQSRYIYVIFSSVIEHVISTGYLLT